jgi:hypothetical protein
MIDTFYKNQSSFRSQKRKVEARHKKALRAEVINVERLFSRFYIF